ncbi:MAG: methionine adenosyltransferase [Haloplanus sp.]
MSDRNIRIESVDRRAVEDQEVEIVERKGIGHPDSLCDGIAENVSRALSNLYLDRVGEVLHYNTDETQLAAGNAAPAFGGGEVVEPIYVLLVGRATRHYVDDDGTEYTLPVDSVAHRAARDYLGEVVPELEFGTDVVVDVRLGEGSGDLQTVFGEDGAAVPMANDTSFGVGHAPLTETERIVLDAEEYLNGPYAEENPELGPDVKIMGKREGDHIDLTVAAAMIDRYLSGMADYRDAVANVREAVTDLAEDHTDRTVAVEVNTADDYDEGAIYLTTTGTSAEQGDDGSVGRGNRANGLITPNRPMSMEATSGKNPVNHIGKIYNLLSTRIAEQVVDEVDGIRDLRVRLLSQIGRPIDRPHVADTFVVTEDDVALADIEADIEAIVDRELADVTDVTQDVIDGDIRTF